MKENVRKDGERVVREVVERIKLEAPHADPIIVSALVERIRSFYGNGRSTGEGT
jgi:hypothetical protein